MTRSWSNVRSRETGTVHTRTAQDRTACGLNPYKFAMQKSKLGHTCGACSDALARRR